MVKVTIGLPFYNAEAHLADAIRSVFSQSHGDWELILVDDGSTDRSLEIALSVRDPRVQVISDGRNLRLATRLNQIVDRARTETIVRMDADDLMPPERIARQLEVLESRPEIDLVSTGVISVDEEDRPVGARWHHDDKVTRMDLVRKIGAGIVHAAVAGRRSWFLRNRYQSSVPIGQDYELWLRASRATDIPIAILQEPLYYYREFGSATPAKLFRGYELDRAALWNNRRGYWETRYIAKSLSKSMALRLIVSLGRFESLLERRSAIEISDDLRAKFDADLQLIRSTSVPGLLCR